MLDRTTVEAGLEKLGICESLEATIRGLRQPQSRVAALELSWYMRNQLLRDADWAGMAHSLEIRVPLVDDVALAAHALAYIVIANRRFTDLFEWGQRSVRLSLAAEIQHRLLPGAFTCEGGQFTLAAWLEPAGEIAGDSFDFAIERDTLHLSMSDARGHAVDAVGAGDRCSSARCQARRAGVWLVGAGAPRQRGARRVRARGATS